MENTQTPFSNLAMPETQILAVMRSMKKGATMVVRTITIARMNKRNNPFYGDCFKDSTSLYVSGVSYQNCVNNKLEREGCEADFKAEKGSGVRHDDENNFINVSDDGTKRYLILQQAPDTKRETTYIHSDGRKYTEYELGILEQFLIKPKPSKKQEEAGLTAEKQQRFINVDIRNVISIRQKEEHIFTVPQEQETIA